LKKHGPFKILREPIITSARKVRMHSPRFVLAQSLFIAFGGKNSLRKREKLALWYDGKREHRAARAFFVPNSSRDDEKVERVPSGV
jgi:hypothetical protein